MPSAEIITIGTEILLGEIVDTNTRYIARTLRGMGVDLYRTVTIGDNAERIAESIRNSMSRAEIIITTGGLGPTVDDPTREAVALATGMELEFRQDLWEQVVAIISRYGRKPSENQKRQAYIPKGALGISNPVGTAPCFIVETERNAVISLPGVPNEMEYILHESIIPYLQTRFNLNEIIKIRILHCAGLGEGMIDEQIADLEILSNPTIGLAAHTGVVDIRIAAKAKNEAEADEMIAKIENQVRERLGNVVFGVDEDRTRNHHPERSRQTRLDPDRHRIRTRRTTGTQNSSHRLFFGPLTCRAHGHLARRPSRIQNRRGARSRNLPR